MRGILLFVIYQVFMRNFLRILVGVKYINVAELNKHAQFILVANHNSHIDTMALMSALSYSQIKKTHPVAAGDYFGSSPLKSFITRLFTNALLIQRSKNAEGQNPIQAMSASLVKGDSLILFPEGSRGEPQKMQQFKKGVGLLLKKHPNIAYIPVYMTGMGRILPKGERLLIPFDSYVVFGEASYSHTDDTEAIVKEIEEKIIALGVAFQKSKFE